ncbi:hypothetical protein [Leifsonia shinshuensis]|uniref:hypothetical protein n=1 Tax=Leifsonia shinshuensis TaxID=150026 RepID=UPI00285A0FDD|nr:hypothetical protein [Leifsonia shinshuensis]MDR6971495.1 hypothetical protein [Leifsonia shinshuensis]
MTDPRLTTLDDELTIVFPGTWVMIPLHDDEAAARRIQRLVADRVGRADRLARVRRTAKSELERLVALANGSTAFALALSLEILPGVPFPASIVLSREEWPTRPEPGADPAVHLARCFPDDEALDFSFGPVRRRSTVRTSTYEEESAPELVADYRFAVPGGERLVHARVNAPMAAAPDLYLELFDAMIDSISSRAPLGAPAAAR